MDGAAAHTGTGRRSERWVPSHPGRVGVGVPLDKAVLVMVLLLLVVVEASPLPFVGTVACLASPCQPAAAGACRLRRVPVQERRGVGQGSRCAGRRQRRGVVVRQRVVLVGARPWIVGHADLWRGGKGKSED